MPILEVAVALGLEQHIKIKKQEIVLEVRLIELRIKI